MNARHAIAALTVIALLGCMAECEAAPAQNNVSAPMPPPRPADLGVQGPIRSPNPDGTDVRDAARAAGAKNPTGSKGRSSPGSETPPSNQTAPSAATTMPTSQSSDAAFPALPAASRARMRDCGRAWEEMKRTGQAKDLTWRDFATKCLTR